MESRAYKTVPVKIPPQDKMTAEIYFGDEKTKEVYLNLQNSTTEDRKLFEWLKRAFEDIKTEPNCGIQIPKRLWPKEYIQKYGITNLWKYDLPNAWRLIYSIGKEKVIVIAIILEWFDHKEYERRFNY